jgi:hypothetical protein
MDFGSKFILLRLDDTIFVPDFEKKLEEGIVQVAQKSNNIQSRYENGETCLLDILDTVSRFKEPKFDIKHNLIKCHNRLVKKSTGNQ